MDLNKIRDDVTKNLPEDQRIGNSDNWCMDSIPGYCCTREKGHKGQHIAHGILGYPCNSWPND